MAVRLGGIEFGITVDLSDLKKGLTDAEAQVEKFSQAVAKIGERVGKATEQAGQIGTLAKILQQVTTTAGDLDKAIDNLGTKFGNLAVRTNAAASRIAGAGTQAAAAGQQFNTTGNLAQGVAGNLNAVAKSADKLGASLEGSTEKQKDAKKATDEQTESTELLNNSVLALAEIFAGLNFANFIKDATLLAGRVENLGTVLHNVGVNAGYNREQLDLFSDRMVKLGITTRQSREILALMSQSELDLAKSTQLARVAQDAAVIAGVNSSDAAEQLTLGIQRTNTWMLRQLGILVNLRQLYARWADENGRLVNGLSAQEKQQILLNEVLRKGTLIAGTYEAAMGDAFKRFTSLDRFVEEAKRSFGEQFQAIFKTLVDITTELLKFWTNEIPDSLKTLVAGVSVATTVFITFAGAIKAASIALSLYTAASEAAAASSLANASGLTRILAGASALALPLAIAAGGLIVVSAAIRNANKEAKEYIETQRKQAQATQDLADARQTVSELSNTTDLTARQTERLDDAITTITAHLPKYGLEINKLRDNLKGLLNFVDEKNPLAALTPEQRIRDAEAELETARTRLGNARKKYVSDLQQTFIGKLNPAAVLTDPAAQAQLKDFLKPFELEVTGAKAKLEKLKELADEQDRPRLSQLAKDSEVATNLAIHAEAQFQSERKKLWKDAGLDILDEYDKFQAELKKKGFQTAKQITDYATIEANTKKRENQSNFEQQTQGLRPGSDAYKEKERNKATQDEQADRNAKKYIDEQLTDMARRRAAAAEAENIRTLKTNRLLEERAEIEEKTRRVAAGENEQIVDQELKIRKARKDAAETQDVYSKKVIDRQKEIADRQIEYNAAAKEAAKDLSNKTAATSKDKAQQDLDEATKTLQVILDQQKSAQDIADAKDEEATRKLWETKRKIVQDELDKINDALGESAGTLSAQMQKDFKNVETALAKVSTKVKDLEKRELEVGEFLQSKQFARDLATTTSSDPRHQFAEANQSGAAIFKEYAAQVQKATNGQQLSDLLKLSGQEFEDAYKKAGVNWTSAVEGFKGQLQDLATKQEAVIKTEGSLADLKKDEVRLSNTLNLLTRERNKQEEEVVRLLKAQQTAYQAQLDAINKSTAALNKLATAGGISGAVDKQSSGVQAIDTPGAPGKVTVTSASRQTPVTLEKKVYDANTRGTGIITVPPDLPFSTRTESVDDRVERLDREARHPKQPIPLFRQFGFPATTPRDERNDADLKQKSLEQSYIQRPAGQAIDPLATQLQRVASSAKDLNRAVDTNFANSIAAITSIHESVLATIHSINSKGADLERTRRDITQSQASLFKALDASVV